MKASELRVDNIIGWYEPNQEVLPVKVSGIVGQMIFAHVNGTFQQCHENYQSWKPIPLTEEWLKKFGFTRAPWGLVKNGLLFVDNIKFPCQELRLQVGNGFVVTIEHVHQLQNLYWCLCGEELELKHD